MLETSISKFGEEQSFEAFVVENEPMGTTANIQEPTRSSADLERVTGFFMGPTAKWADECDDVGIAYVRKNDDELAVGLTDERDD
jgi:hypothetical protein